MSKKPPDFKGLNGVYELVKRLRAPDGCPWDRKQTNKSLKYNVIEEAYELLDAIDRDDNKSMMEELGDLLFLILMHIRIAEEEGRFTLEDVTKGIIDKMVSRHPHVFGNTKVETHEEILQNWEKIKGKERKSIFDGISYGVPALLLAQTVGERARRVGFDWDNKHGVVEKIKEEIDEFEEAIQYKDRARLEEEFGDILFALVNLARHLDINAEDALRNTVRKFISRFRKIEEFASRKGIHLSDLSLEEMEKIWQMAKKG